MRSPQYWMTNFGFAALGLCALLYAQGTTAQGQLLDQLKGAVGGGQSGGLGAGLPSVDKAGPGNTAGVLQYCVQNNYVSGGAASSVKNSLMSKVAGPSDSGFKAGSAGKLDTGNGQSYSLGGGGDDGGMKDQVKHKVCDLVLQHAKSLL
jgi:hypothetical protein